MPIASYTDLVAELQSFANRTDISQEIPTFIAMAEAKFNREVRSRLMVVNDYALSTTVGARTVAAPTDMLEPSYMEISGGSPLGPVDIEKLNELRRFRLKQPGTPLFYAVNGAQIELCPTPSAVINLELDYYAKVPALTVANPTNWLLANHPDLYVNECLAIVAQFLQDAEALSANQDLAGNASGGVNSENARATLSQERRVDPTLMARADGSPTAQ